MFNSERFNGNNEYDNGCGMMLALLAFRVIVTIILNFLPTALRPDAQLGRTHSPKKGLQANKRSKYEPILTGFRSFSGLFWDRTRIICPADENLLRTPGAFDDLREDIKKQWPCDKLLPLLALAQHYGVLHSASGLVQTSPLIAAHFGSN